MAKEETATHFDIYSKMRNKAGLNQDRASEYLNISKRYLQYIEARTYIPRIDLVSKMADLYGCDISAFKMETGLVKYEPNKSPYKSGTSPYAPKKS